jgi:hypothetical protein
MLGSPLSLVGNGETPNPLCQPQMFGHLRYLSGKKSFGDALPNLTGHSASIPWKCCIRALGG